MIIINQDQLTAVEYLIQQSAQGNHMLFDLDVVRRVFTTTSSPMSPSEMKEVECHLETLISLGSLEKQKAYVQALPEEVLYRVIKTYFNIVENYLFERNVIRQ